MRARRELLSRPSDVRIHETLFAALDSDFSGALSADEVSALLGVSVVEAERLVREFDTDRSGKLDIDEFRELAVQVSLRFVRVFFFFFFFFFVFFMNICAYIS